ncbi:hypothetical protein GS461_18965 [Rhodococcus hoagii]|nr:hypothetical protein [Prescottella equi]
MFDNTSSGNGRNYVGFPIRHPGRYFVEWHMNIESLSGPVRLRHELGAVRFPADGSNLSPLTPMSSYLNLANTGDVGTVTARGSIVVSTMPADTLYPWPSFLCGLAPLVSRRS